MPTDEFQVPFLLDYLATFFWAVSGTAVAIHKRLDLMGVALVAVLASTGGGLIRDGLFLHRTPSVLTSPVYLPLILAAAAVTILFRRWIIGISVIDVPVSVIDAIGTPAFAVVGMQYALQAGIALPGVVLVGVLNGYGGGILRDILVNDVPAVLRPGHYSATVALVACLIFLALTRWLHAPATAAAWGVMALYLVARMVTIRFDLRTRPVLVERRERRG